MTALPVGIDTRAIWPTAMLGTARLSESTAFPGRLTVVSISEVMVARAGMSRTATTTTRGATTSVTLRLTELRYVNVSQPVPSAKIPAMMKVMVRRFRPELGVAARIITVTVVL